MQHLIAPWVLLALAVFVTLAGMPLQAQQAAASGDAPVTSYSDPALPGHTIYRPAALRGKLPVVLWGNGSCVNSNFGYREFLTEIAAQGFIVLAVGPWRDSPAPRQQRPADPSQWPPFETQPAQLLDALDWIADASASSTHALHEHVDTTKVAAMGHSCGALQALKISTDKRITTTLVLNSGLFPDGDQYMTRFDLERAVLGELHAPIAYFIGGETDVAYVNAEQDWQDLQSLQLPAINANMDVGHGATYAQVRGGPFASAPLAWLRWQLKDDANAAAMFRGDRCGFCTDASWTLRTHNLP